MTVTILHGDCRTVLPTLPAGSFQACVTSPPYYNLRDYGVAGQIGLEPTPDEYVAEMVAVFREVRRCLRDDGVLFLNIGDKYAKNGQRLGMPPRVALALQKDGWWWRDEIIWHKPRTTPFPANDRTVPAHEMVYLLAKAPGYFFDWAAIEEPSAFPGLKRDVRSAFRDKASFAPGAQAGSKKYSDEAARVMTVRDTRRSRSVWSISPEPYKGAHFATMPASLAKRCILAGSRAGDAVLDPFGGAGTTGLVADRLGRDATLIELNADYRALATARLQGDASLLAAIS